MLNCVHYNTSDYTEALDSLFCLLYFRPLRNYSFKVWYLWYFKTYWFSFLIYYKEVFPGSPTFTCNHMTGNQEILT